ncbi:hypothetical protein EJB05_09500, partial [Eragrostis curvula]
MTSNPGSRMTAAGFAVMLLGVSAGVGSDEHGALLGLVGVLVGASFIAVGVRRMAQEEEQTTPVGPEEFASVVALGTCLHRNLPVVGLAMASCTITAVAGKHLFARVPNIMEKFVH